MNTVYKSDNLTQWMSLLPGMPLGTQEVSLVLNAKSSCYDSQHKPTDPGVLLSLQMFGNGTTFALYHDAPSLSPNSRDQHYPLEMSAGKTYHMSTYTWCTLPSTEDLGLLMSHLIQLEKRWALSMTQTLETGGLFPHHFLLQQMETAPQRSIWDS